MSTNEDHDSIANLSFSCMDPSSDSENDEAECHKLPDMPSPIVLEALDKTYPAWRSTPKRRVKTSVEILSTACCMYGCNLMISRHAILTTRMLLMDVGRRDKKASTFLNAVQVLTKPLTTADNKLRPLLDNIRVCSNLFAQVLGLSLSRLFANIEANQEGARVHGREGALYTREKTIEAVAAGICQINSLGQADPTGGILMPAGYSRSDFAKECRPDESFKYTRFRAITKRRAKFKQADSHLRCSTCSLLARSLILNRGNASKRREIVWMRRLHFEDIRKERYLIKATERMARAEPSRLAVLKHDSMAKDGTKLPALVSRGKGITDGSRIPACLHTVQLAKQNSNGGSYTNYVYLNPASATEGGSDYYVSMLLHTLAEMTVVPPMLVIHQDNCIANKSDAFFGFCSWLLLQLKELEEIRVVYSAVGHTHDSVDAFFGSLRKSMRTTDIHTLEDLLDYLKKMRSVHQVQTVPPVYSFSPLCGMTKGYEWKASQHQFIFRRDGNGGVSFSYCRWLGNAEFSDESTGRIKEWPMFETRAKAEEATKFMPDILPLRILRLNTAISTVIAAVTPYLDSTQLLHFQDLGQELENQYSNSDTIATLLSRIRSKCVPVSPASTVTQRATLNKFIENNRTGGRRWQPIQPINKRRRVTKT